MDQLGSHLRGQLGDQIRSQLMDQLWEQLREQLKDHLRGQLSNQLNIQLRGQLRDQLRGQLRGQLEKNSPFPYGWGALESYWIAFYDYISTILLPNVLDEKTKKLFEIFKKLAMYGGYAFVFENYVFISDKPTEIHFKNKLLHNDGGLSVAFSDGTGLYNLNGVPVTKEIAETPGEKLNPELILNEQNVDVQREIIKKIGADIVLKKLNAKCIDEWIDPNTNCKYELMHLKVNSLDRLYMYYEHASIIGYFYAQPVPPETKKAMHGRAWQIGLIERNELENIDKNKECKILNNLPEVLS